MSYPLPVTLLILNYTCTPTLLNSLIQEIDEVLKHTLYTYGYLCCMTTHYNGSKKHDFKGVARGGSGVSDEPPFLACLHLFVAEPRYRARSKIRVVLAIHTTHV